LVPFITSLNGADPGLIRFDQSPTIPDKYYYSNTNELVPAKSRKAVNFKLSHVNWRKMSFTSLAATHTATPKNNSNGATGDYDFFVFKQLVKGNKTGNLLHHIFENIDFTNSSYWHYPVQNALRSFMPKHREDYGPMLLQLLQQITNVTIDIGGNRFTLADIEQEKRLNELEFDFNVPEFNPSDLNGLEDDGTSIRVKYYESVEGIMNGKMDMFFEHGGKYYILDWKSNFLGDTLDYYKKDLLHGAMSENNYHLQYLLYTVASKKYLESRLPRFNYERDFGGVIYMFVRGIRSGGDTGVFTTKPSFNTIEKLEGILENRVLE
jgi:exodeoxyribonuclease V beta subunit